MAIIVTGTPGTGKTTIAKRIAKEKKYKYVDGKKIIELFKLNESYDKKRKCYIVDEQKFATICENTIANDPKIVIDSHLSQFISPNCVECCVVTHCDLKKLEKRLKKRKYTKAKITENLEAEIFRVCELEAKERGHKIKNISTD